MRLTRILVQVLAAFIGGAVVQLGTTLIAPASAQGKPAEQSVTDVTRTKKLEVLDEDGKVFLVAEDGVLRVVDTSTNEKQHVIIGGSYVIVGHVKDEPGGRQRITTSSVDSFGLSWNDALHETPEKGLPGPIVTKKSYGMGLTGLSASDFVKDKWDNHLSISDTEISQERRDAKEADVEKRIRSGKKGWTLGLLPDYADEKNPGELDSGLVFFGDTGKPVFRAGVTALEKRGTVPTFIMGDKDGNTRLMLGWSKVGKPSIYFYDAEGNQLEVLGGK